MKKRFKLCKALIITFLIGAVVVSCNTQPTEEQSPEASQPVQSGQQASMPSQQQMNASRQMQARFMALYDSLTSSQKNMLFTEVKHMMEPQPVKIEPGKRDSDAPSDAIVLFNGKDLNEWQEFPRRMSAPGTPGAANAPREPIPATWVIKDGGMQPIASSGTIQTKRSFRDFQLHIEWKTPVGLDATVTGQNRGNSGVIIQGTYEIQILDSYTNQTYINGQAGAVYMQYAPLVNPSRKEGEWQTYDIIYTAPRFKDSTTYFTPPRITLLYNGVLVQNDVSVQGPTVSPGIPKYVVREHGDGPIQLQQHGNPTTFRNIWIREL